MLNYLKDNFEKVARMLELDPGGLLILLAILIVLGSFLIFGSLYTNKLADQRRNQKRKRALY